jgi:hypothetical protein
VGLGLSSAYAIMKNHDGLITVSSEPGDGATFSLYFPIREREAAAPTALKPEVVVEHEGAERNGYAPENQPRSNPVRTSTEKGRL